MRRVNPAIALFAGAAAASSVLLIILQSHLVFLIDEWDLLIQRHGFTAHSLLDQHANHLVLGPALIYQAILHTFGMGSQVPYAVAAVTLFIASATMLFVYLRSRLGGWVALAAVLPVLVMGTAYEDLLGTFQMSYTGSLAFGIGALLAVERGDRRGDQLACLLLIASLAFAEIALGFTAAVIVAIAVQRGPVRRVWIPAAPILLYVAWYAAFGHSGLQSPNSLNGDSTATSFPYVLDGVASSLASLLGLGSTVLGGGPGRVAWGRPLLVLVLVLLCIWAMRDRRPFRGWVLVPVTASLTFWFLTAANSNFARLPYAPRYQLVGAVFLLLIAAELGVGWRPRSTMLVLVFTVAAAAALGNLGALRDNYRHLKVESTVVRGDLGGLEIAADQVSPDFTLTPQNSGFNYVGLITARSYLPAIEDFGSPAYSEAELSRAPESARRAADQVMAAGLPIRLERLPKGQRPAPGPQPRLIGPSQALIGSSPECLVLTPRTTPAAVSLPPGGARLHAAPGVGAQLQLRRFASDSFPVSVGTLRGASELDIPRDRSERRWELQIGATGKVKVCGQ